MTNNKVRVRFAPSPTGPLHIGGVRTALYNYLFAKKHGGDFLLRIEDTDQSRYVPAAEQYIVDSLKWCGIKIDEGVTVGGPFAPYRQSERKVIYRQYADKLINDGNAYFAFDTPEELEKLRKNSESQGKSFSYDCNTRNSLRNSLNLPKEETDKLLTSGSPYVMRLKVPLDEIIEMNDLIRGQVKVSSSKIDDKVLFKSDGMPTYHLANVVDDYLMKITHVIRGEEWLPSLPLHILLYRFLGWKDVMPEFAHLPLLLKPDGKGKLSKRDGDKIGFPVFPLEWKDPASGELSSGYRESGYFPETVINLLAFLGWNPGTEQEIFNMEQLVGAFSLEHVHKAGAKFDFEKAKWYNHQYLILRSNEELADLFLPVLKENGIKAELDYVIKVCSLVKDRVNFVNEIWQQSSFFFIAPESYDQEAIKKRWKDNIPQLVEEIKVNLIAVDPFSADNIKNCIYQFVEVKQSNMGAVMNSLRLAIVGGLYGPDLPIIAELLGKDEVIRRIEKAISNIKI
jgi:glutamyl-tRNA synthetase